MPVANNVLIVASTDGKILPLIQFFTLNHWPGVDDVFSLTTVAAIGDRPVFDQGIDICQETGGVLLELARSDIRGGNLEAAYRSPALTDLALAAKRAARGFCQEAMGS